MENKSCLRISFSLVIFYFSGAFSALISNVLFHIEAKGFNNVQKDFRKPWIQVWGMFLALILLIFWTPIFNKCRCKDKIPRTKKEGLQIFLKMAIPAIFNLISSSLSLIACLYLAPSIWQMFRGSTLIFTGFCNRIVNKKIFDLPDVLGMFLTFIGLIIVGISSIITSYYDEPLNYGSSISRELISFLLVLISQAFHSVQTVFEMKYLKETNATEYEVASFEGIWGILFTSFIMMPITSAIPESCGEGIYEQNLESFYMLFHSWKLLVTFISYIILLTIFNYEFINVTNFSSPKERNICDVLRPIAVWIFSIIVYDVLPKTRAGEPVTLYSLIELAGFVFMFFGSCLYNRLIKMKHNENDIIRYDSVKSADLPLIDGYGM